MRNLAQRGTDKICEEKRKAQGDWDSPCAPTARRKPSEALCFSSVPGAREWSHGSMLNKLHGKARIN